MVESVGGVGEGERGTKRVRLRLIIDVVLPARGPTRPPGTFASYTT